MDESTIPPELAEFVACSPDRLGGEVLFKGTRVPVRVLFEYLEGGYDLNEFLDDFEGVTREQAVGVLHAVPGSLFRERRAA
ncbi:MAG: DUF433 domain-containing protein [Planctomycetes bacterium]|nr:DUF433 domain-containing protein [Planctomycetota bacterium]